MLNKHISRYSSPLIDIITTYAVIMSMEILMIWSPTQGQPRVGGAKQDAEYINTKARRVRLLRTG